ncbi:hypothetical protein BC834DRAFT_515571 [Gloeopeniophorella convolvens]|nr:hypothetical protein BC834DRAFT_515571 [Gloeopeniophorella convolvens]
MRARAAAPHPHPTQHPICGVIIDALIPSRESCISVSSRSSCSPESVFVIVSLPLHSNRLLLYRIVHLWRRMIWWRGGSPCYHLSPQEDQRTSRGGDVDVGRLLRVGISACRVLVLSLHCMSCTRCLGTGRACMARRNICGTGPGHGRSRCPLFDPIR